MERLMDKGKDRGFINKARQALAAVVAPVIFSGPIVHPPTPNIDVPQNHVRGVNGLSEDAKSLGEPVGFITPDVNVKTLDRGQEKETHYNVPTVHQVSISSEDTKEILLKLAGEDKLTSRGKRIEVNNASGFVDLTASISPKNQELSVDMTQIANVRVTDSAGNDISTSFDFAVEFLPKDQSNPEGSGSNASAFIVVKKEVQLTPDKTLYEGAVLATETGLNKLPNPAGFNGQTEVLAVDVENVREPILKWAKQKGIEIDLPERGSILIQGEIEKQTGRVTHVVAVGTTSDPIVIGFSSEQGLVVPAVATLIPEEVRPARVAPNIAETDGSDPGGRVEVDRFKDQPLLAQIDKMTVDEVKIEAGVNFPDEKHMGYWKVLPDGREAIWRAHMSRNDSKVEWGWVVEQDKFTGKDSKGTYTIIMESSPDGERIGSNGYGVIKLSGSFKKYAEKEIKKYYDGKLDGKTVHVLWLKDEYEGLNSPSQGFAYDGFNVGNDIFMYAYVQTKNGNTVANADGFSYDMDAYAFSSSLGFVISMAAKGEMGNHDLSQFAKESANFRNEMLRPTGRGKFSNYKSLVLLGGRVTAK